MTFVASPRIRSVGCIYADRCVYAPNAAYTHMCLYAVVGAYTEYAGGGAYTRVVGAYTRTVGVYTQEGCIRTPSRIHRFLCPYAAPTAFTQESTNRNVYVMPRVRGVHSDTVIVAPVLRGPESVGVVLNSSRYAL